MNKAEVIAQTEEYVKSKLYGEATGHDWWHAFRVLNNAKLICEQEPNADRFIVELAALLHDIADWKFTNGNEKVADILITDFLAEHDVPEEIIKSVIEIVETLSFKGANVKTPMATIEGKIVQDADRLDAIGAIGIARTFAYGACAGQEIYDPNIKPHLHSTFEEYKNTKSTSLNHFYEKLLLLTDRMNTQSAKNIAQKRHEFMETYLSEFFAEWNGEK